MGPNESSGVSTDKNCEDARMSENNGVWMDQDREFSGSIGNNADSSGTNRRPTWSSADDAPGPNSSILDRDQTRGTWGEPDIQHVEPQEAMYEYSELQRHLSRKGTATSRGSHTHDNAPEENDFHLDDFLLNGPYDTRTAFKKVGVLYRNLTVKGTGSTATFVRTLPHAVLGTFGPDLYHLLCRYIPPLRRRGEQTRVLLHDFNGCVRPGEMLLVLGRPGAGCSTFLKSISNDRASFTSVEGNVSYGGISAEKQKKTYRGEVNYNPEDDVHFPSLNVWQTLKFALMTKTKKKARPDVLIIADALMKMFGIQHTRLTVVGDEYTRGVSGGERKRVSIAETMASKSTIICWDNATRGLDASTALDYARSLRVMTDITHRTTLVTLYQAGEGIYDLFDKVLVIDQGREIFMGKASEAKQYFIDIGFECPPRQTTADFLTAVTNPVERQFRPGMKASTPKTAKELEDAFRQSPHYLKMRDDMKDYEEYLAQTNHRDAEEFKGTVQAGKSKHVPNRSPYVVSFPRQVSACVKREFWLFFGDRTSLYTKAFVIISNGLIVGSMFYNQSSDTQGAFSRGGTLFMSILFLGWFQMSELIKAVSGRAIIARHRDYAFYRPSAVSVARVITDLPIVAVQALPFALIMYFMTNLTLDAGRFWIYCLFVYTTTLVITALYRMFASISPEIDSAVRFSGLGLNLLVIYTGYVIPKTQLLGRYIWFGWLYYINPISASFEGVLGNEMAGRNMQCAPSQLVPQGRGTDPVHQGCAFPGADVNGHTVTGGKYLSSAFGYSRKHLWRNFGILVAFGVLYMLITIFAVEVVDFSKSGGGALVFKRSKRAKREVATAPADEEMGGETSSEKAAEYSGEEDSALQQITQSKSVFTWRDVEYTVPYVGGEKKLLNKINGYAKPGVMVALVGASGAGKTTLLNTLAQRQTTGVVKGDVLVDGRPLGLDFQRNTGFCLQGDLHDDTATIREALEFSAILRQPASTPKAEKIAYVDQIINLLELEDLQDAIIQSLGVEQRKRLTIGVELAAKPSLLLFLDEPTSGLDSQSAYSIVRFLKKLARAGQAIVCTIHQPSSVLIQEFDMILALIHGNAFYFGSVEDVIDYFSHRGVNCPPDKNVAEFILETAAKPHRRSDGTKIDWAEEWRISPQAQAIIDDIESLKLTQSQSAASTQSVEDEMEFAAPVTLQTVELTKRLFRQYWRNPSYVYGKLFVAVIIGIFNGFTFYKLGHTVQDMQNRMFTSFLILTIPATVVNAVVPKFFSNLSLWQAREHPSRIYGWIAFTTAQVVGEIPQATAQAVLYFLLWYFPAGLPHSAAGYVFLMTWFMFLFMSSWGQWISAFAPSFTVVSNVLPFFFVIFSIFNGVLVPYAAMPQFWRAWMYWLNPSMWWIRGVLSATLQNTEVRCAGSEMARFTPPSGITCADYAASFVRAAGGYLTGSDGAVCGYCPYKNGQEFLRTLNVNNTGEKWRDCGIFAVFVLSNWVLVYAFVLSVRVKNWSFGFGVLGKGLEWVRKTISRRGSWAGYV
ncbi:ABC transporter-like protein [Piedraia hortae CBS 480.64]|uniref:ABC transporter-like protein n=1 Tax=Piedraia hortae CBS 480.64 TaxID=1314780 RepID=A0A6A7C9Z1_9PEZI|nr:ABC transporter-like protein [Piedraia hortae CBS 480.64]